jgi:hypothetical protein
MTDNPANILNSYAMRVKQDIIENTYFVRRPEGLFSCFKITVGEHSAVGEFLGDNIKRRHLRMIACKNFVDAYRDIIEESKPKPKQGIDYMEYSSHTVLSNVKKVVVNDVKIFDKLRPTLVAFDSEGIPPTLAQLCFDENTVALFHLPRFNDLIKYFLQDPTITKIVCDVGAEERNFGVKVNNFIDIGICSSNGVPTKPQLSHLHKAFVWCRT